MWKRIIEFSVALLISVDRLVAGDFSAWSVPANSGEAINSAFGDFAPSLSRDGLTLYFFSDRPGGYGGNDIWVSRRADLNAPWRAPENLGLDINSSGDENAPTLSVDGHRLYFASDRPGGAGGLDLYVSRRHDTRDDLSWRCPENLGDGVNGTRDEAAVALFEHDATGHTSLYFHSNRSGNDDIYVSEMGSGETFGAAAPVVEINTPFLERLPSIRRDGLELSISSNRPGTMGSLDLWVTTRGSVSEPWRVPVNLGAPINTPALEGRGWLSFDGMSMYFHSFRPEGTGALDLYVSTRTRSKQ
jgi:hypothetical protein